MDDPPRLVRICLRMGRRPVVQVVKAIPGGRTVLVTAQALSATPEHLHGTLHALLIQELSSVAARDDRRQAAGDG